MKWLVMTPARALLIGLLGVLWGGAAGAAQWANPQLLLTPEELQKNLTKADWVVLDCRDLDNYLKGHIPGAISLGKPCGNALRDASARVLSAKKYEDLFGKVGIGNNTHVVVYHGDMKDFTHATVAFWILEFLGHDGKVHLLNGGLDAWRKAGMKLDDKPARRDATTFKATVVKNRYSSTDEVLAIARGTEKGVQLVDSRTEKEHMGEDIRSLRGGHVPNTSANVSHLDTLPKVKDPKTEKMVPIAYLDPAVVTKAFSGVDKNKRAVGYCQTGTRSTLTYLQFRLLGFKDPSNWDDSWRVYGAKVDYPAVEEQWFNFDGQNRKVKALEQKVVDLEAAQKKQ
jgi:thiosulfate/3-mercaptopyruvate sulfurtransferase